MRRVWGLSSGCPWYVTRVRCSGATVGVQCSWARFDGASRPYVGVVFSRESAVVTISPVEFSLISHVSIASYGRSTAWPVRAV